MITPEPQKWEYIVMNLNVLKSPTGGEAERAEKVAALLNTKGQGAWELVSTINAADNILPEGFVILKRPFQAPKVEAKPWYKSTSPKVVAAAKVAKVVVPPAAQPIVAVAAAALSPTAGKTDSKATA